MCGRYVITSPPAALRQIFGYVEQPNFPPRHNIAPTQPIPVVIIENNARHFRLMRWGLLPAWVEDPRKFTLLINARSETVLEKPAFKNAIKRRRCLIPADGYYEWQASATRKRPHFVHRRDGAPMGLAGLAETWIGCSDDSAESVMALLRGPGEGEFVWHEVSIRVNRVANDDAQLILPITAEQREAEEPKPKKPAPRKPLPAAPDDGQGSLF